MDAARKFAPETGQQDLARILVIDPDPHRLTSLGKALGSSHVLAIGALDYADAFDTIRREELLVVVLPFTGEETFELARKIRGEPGKSEIPILFLFDTDPSPLLRKNEFPLHWYDILVVRTKDDELLRDKVEFFYQLRHSYRRMTAQQAHLEVELQFRQLVDSLPEYIWTASPTGEVTFVNARLREVFGDVYGVSWRSILHPAEQKRVLQHWQECLKSGKPYEDRQRLRDKNGNYRWFMVRGIPIRDQSREIFQWIGTSSDIHQDAVEFSKSRHFMDSLVENLPEMVFVKDARELRFVRVNRAAEKLLGLTRQTLIGKNDYDFFPKEQADFFTGKDRKVLTSGNLEDILEEPIDTPEGRKILHTKKIPLYGEDGNPEYLLGISQNITEERADKEKLRVAYEDMETRVQERTRELARANELLREKSDTMQAILASLSDGVILLDPNRKVIFRNQVAAALTGGAPGVSEQHDRLFRESVIITDEDGRHLELEDLPGRKVLSGDYSARPVVVKMCFPKRRVEYWVMVSAAPVFDDKGKLTHAVIVLKEFTERKRLEERQRVLALAGPMLSSSLDYDQTLMSVAKMVVPGVADWVYINLMDRDGAPRTAVTYHWNPEFVKKVEEIRKQYPRDWQAGIADPRVFKTGKSELYPELNEHILTVGYRSAERARAMMETFHPKSAMIVPLRGSERVLGVLSLVSSESGRCYDESDLGFAEELASRAALAIENALLYKRAGEAIALRDEFLTIASHELKTPITSLKLQLQMARRRLNPAMGAPPSPELLEHAFDLAITQVGRLTSLVEDLLDVSRMRAGKLGLNFGDVNVSEMMNELIERYRPHFEATKTPLVTRI